MGVTTFTEEISGPIAPARIFKAGILDSHNLLPKLLPDKIKSIEVHGDGGPGSIEQINLAEGGPFKCIKHRIEELDKENFMCKHTLIEGGVIGDKIIKVVETVKFEASPNGSVCKITSEFHTADNSEVKEEEVKIGKDMAIGIAKVVEAYLLQNPNAYA
ncbi:major strawberry allergen Fra a 1.07-like [Macadamia integrifolia]|uniref:major strawberry allergen Fra a 1.07-like n=1 Tax=Macadamia integrifolia TaxID=60698 RepID=UPI001C52BF49|nr:major strawberry allergen Fra a 1.07-like [Macadamia integrifolia]